MLQPDTFVRSGPTRRQLLRSLRAAVLAGPAAWAHAATRAPDVGVSAGEILVGQNITLQGGRNAYGGEAQAGIKAWVSETNRMGGVWGRRIVLRTFDDENDSSRAEANARRLVADGVFVLFGSLEGGPSTAVMKAALELGVPFIGPMAGSPGLRRPHQDLVFPVRAEHREEFRALIAHGHSLGYRNVALFHADSSVGREHLANVERLAVEIGVQPAGGASFKSDITDEQLRLVASAFAANKVEVVINHGSPAIYGRLIRQARGLGLRTSYWGVNSGSSPLALSLGSLAHGMVFTQIVPNPASGKSALGREYQALNAKVNPGMPLTYGGMEGFMTAKALTLALQAAGAAPTRDSLLAGLNRVDADLGGVPLRWRKGDHAGCSFVDLALVGRDGRFIQ
jgi:ABC-type branched-subunit amino acid transport system substrate-binding protein